MGRRWARRTVVMVVVAAAVAGGAAGALLIGDLQDEVSDLRMQRTDDREEIERLSAGLELLRTRASGLETRLRFGFGFSSIESRLDDVEGSVRVLEFDVAQVDSRLSSCVDEISSSLSSDFPTPIYC